jgi:diguanylate cyclase (GGDEF)-like protein
MEDGELLENFTRINNELVNAKRELIRVNHQLDEKERYLTRIMELSPNLIYIRDLLKGRNEYGNMTTTDFFKDLVHARAGGERPLPDLMSPEDSERYRAHSEAIGAAADGESALFEFYLVGPNGETRWFATRESVFARGPDGRASKIIGVVEDISEYKQRESLLKEASLRDGLTGLLNRSGFMEIAGRRLKSPQRRTDCSVLFYIDLDQFKDINDRFGHDAGDVALIAAAGLLKTNFRDSDIIARIGGDEFVVLAAEVDREAVGVLTDRLGASVAAWNDRSGKSWPLSFSIGQVLYDPASPMELAELLRRADESMYAAKRLRSAKER